MGGGESHYGAGDASSSKRLVGVLEEIAAVYRRRETLGPDAYFESLELIERLRDLEIEAARIRSGRVLEVPPTVEANEGAPDHKTEEASHARLSPTEQSVEDGKSHPEATDPEDHREKLGEQEAAPQREIATTGDESSRSVVLGDSVSVDAKPATEPTPPNRPPETRLTQISREIEQLRAQRELLSADALYARLENKEQLRDLEIEATRIRAGDAPNAPADGDDSAPLMEGASVLSQDVERRQDPSAGPTEHGSHIEQTDTDAVALGAALDTMIEAIEEAVALFGRNEIDEDTFRTRCHEAGVAHVDGMTLIYDLSNTRLYAFNGLELVSIDPESLG